MNKETRYHDETPEQVKQWLENLMNTDRRVRLFYGDTDTKGFERVHGRKPEAGKDWGEENGVTGTIGRSMGLKPILLNNSRSMGGWAIMDDCIVRMFVKGGQGWQEVYRHSSYHSKFDNAIVIKSDLPQYSDMVVSQDNGKLEIRARFNSAKSAHNWLAFMQGKRMSK